MCVYIYNIIGVKIFVEKLEIRLYPDSGTQT